MILQIIEDAIENRPIYLKNKPDKTKVAAGLACGSVWTICFGLEKGDFIFVLSKK